MKYLILILTLLCISCTLEECEKNKEIKKWENGIVYYNYEDDFTEKEKTIIRKCMSYWEDGTSIQFIESDKQKYCVRIYRHEDEYQYLATLGQKRKAYMKLGKIALWKKTHITHEIGHVLGLLHEHQRPDRNNYVTIFYNNIEKTYWRHFDVRKNNLYDETLIEYDYDSIMHYGYRTGNNGNGLVLETLHGKLGFTYKPSNKDLEKIKLIYEK